MRRHSAPRLAHRASIIPTNTNIVTISSLGKEVQEMKRQLREIRHMIEIQTEIMEGLLQNYREISSKRAEDLITPKSNRTYIKSPYR